jgi:hypothetical protein
MEDKNNNIDIFEGRTKEWNRNDWQGRSQEQVEGNYKILDWTLASVGIFLLGWAIYTAVTSLFI